MIAATPEPEMQDRSALVLFLASASPTSLFATYLGPAGGVSSGDVKRYQVWYRDPTTSPFGTLFNLTNGLEVAYTP